MEIRIRDAILPIDQAVLESFILGSQRFEHPIASDRRLDEKVGPDYFAVLQEQVGKRNGRILVAIDEDNRPLGWAVAHEQDNEIFVEESQRVYGYISELYVVEEARGRGVGRALISACEEWARERGLNVVMIGVLAGNTRAHAIYAQSSYADYSLMLRKFIGPS